ncbi:MAG TPA: SGNH/GDSL hydrolase family protein [Coleofasciculaceae cyanobacterium]
MNKTILTTGLCLFSCLLPLKATAATFSQMFVFGDSLSDTGNVFNLTSAALGVGIPPTPYFQGRFSNGDNWIDYLAEDFGLNPIPVTTLVPSAFPTQGINFAFGGATTGEANTIDPVLPGLEQQIVSFKGLLAQTNQTADPNALYIVWAGANDYLGGGIQDPTVPVTNLSTAIADLAAVGARNILVANLPNLGMLAGTNNTPVSSGLNVLSGLHNSGLSTALNNLEQILSPEVNLISLDINSLFAQAIANPGDFGFTNVTDACLTDYTITIPPDTDFNVCDNPNEHLFWDDIHPTAATHRYIADLALETLNSEPQKSVPEPASVLGLFAIGVFGAGSMLKRQLAAK